MSHCAVLEKDGKLLDDVDRIVAEVLEYRDHGMFSQDPDVPKHYLESKLDIHVHVRVRRRKDICAVFRVKDAEFENGSNASRLGRVGTYRRSWWVELNAPFISSGHLHIGHRDDNGQYPVLVHNVEVMDDPQGVQFRMVPSVVRLQPLDQCGGRFSGSMYFSTARGHVFLPVHKDGKLNFRLDSAGIGVPIYLDQLPSQMVKTRAEMVNSLSGYDCKSGRGLRVSRVSDFVFDPSGIRVMVLRNSITVIEECCNHQVEALDVLAGPVNLDPAAI